MKDKRESVYVVTGADLFQPEQFMFVTASVSTAERILKEQYPELWVQRDAPDCRTYRDSKDGERLLFIKPETIIQD